MDEKTLSLVTDTPLGLSSDILDKLETYEDYLSFYIQLDQASTAFAWIKVDLLLKMASKMGETSVEQLARDINHPRSTVVNYVRVARAFPKDRRDEQASFSIHFKAAFADSYNDKTGEFDADTRFKWVEKAVDEGMSTRVLGELIQRDKQRELLNLEVLPCSRCKSAEGEIKPYVLYSPGEHTPSERFELHEACYAEILIFIHGN